jgi:hypothetical protein
MPLHIKEKTLAKFENRHHPYGIAVAVLMIIGSVGLMALIKKPHAQAKNPHHCADSYFRDLRSNTNRCAATAGNGTPYRGQSARPIKAFGEAALRR